MPPTLGNGKICYLQIPALDIARSADFYGKVFGWEIRRRDDGSTAFNDAVNEVSGTWVLGRSASKEPGILIFIMVADMAATTALVIENGGEIVWKAGADVPEIVATFRDPGGNLMGLYQQKGLAAA